MTVRAAGVNNESLTIEWWFDERPQATGRLNAFFANSANSPSMSMVNFSCCVCVALDVTRKVAAQPMRSAVRMESGIHAGV
jgi:hypothetical protein